jgi:hypothetical protein
MTYWEAMIAAFAGATYDLAQNAEEEDIWTPETVEYFHDNYAAIVNSLVR